MTAFIRHDGGRSESKRKFQGNDCVVRAIAIAFGVSYDTAYDKLAKAGRKSCRCTPKTVWQPILDRLAVKIRFPPVAGKSRMNVGRFVSEHKKGVYIIQCAKHLLVAVDGVLYDEFKPDMQKCVYNAWNVTKDTIEE